MLGQEASAGLGRHGAQRRHVREALALLDRPDLPLDAPVPVSRWPTNRSSKSPGRWPSSPRDRLRRAHQLADAARRGKLVSRYSNAQAPGIASSISVIFWKRSGVSPTCTPCLRDGTVAGSGGWPDTARREIVSLMVGRQVERIVSPAVPRTPGEVVLSLDRLAGTRRADRRFVRPAPRRNPGHRRAGRHRPHRALALPVGPRSGQSGTVRVAGLTPRPRPMPASARGWAWYPRTAKGRARPARDHYRQCHLQPLAALQPLGLAAARTASNGGRRLDAPPERQGPFERATRRTALGRQPAKGGAGAACCTRTPTCSARRADPRHRRRHQSRKSIA